MVLYHWSGSGSWVLQSSPQTYEATQEKMVSSMTGRLYMHAPLRVAWKGPRVVENMLISTQSRSLKALTFLMYMRVVAFARSHSHTAASCISEPPVCEDKTHTHCIWHLRLYQTSARCWESPQLWMNYRDNSSQNRYFCPHVVSLFIHASMFWFLSLSMQLIHFCLFFNLKSICEQQVFFTSCHHAKYV